MCLQLLNIHLSLGCKTGQSQAQPPAAGQQQHGHAAGRAGSSLLAPAPKGPALPARCASDTSSQSRTTSFSAAWGLRVSGEPLWPWVFKVALCWCILSLLCTSSYFPVSSSLPSLFIALCQIKKCDVWSEPCSFSRILCAPSSSSSPRFCL